MGADHNLYNPSGIVDLPVPDLGLTFDFILVFSVFTHTSVWEMHEILRQLMAMLKSGGTLPSRSRIPITIQ
jgi:Methyltransferase domain